MGQADSPYLTLPADFAENFGFGFDGAAPIDQAIVTFASGNTATFGIVDIAETSNYWSAQFHAATGDTFNVAKKGYDFSDIRRIDLVKKQGSEDYEGTLSVTLTFQNREMAYSRDTPALAIHATIAVPKDSARFPIFGVSEAFGDEELTKHLLSNQLYYSQAIWRALDPATIGILLSGYTWPLSGQAKPLVEFVDPNPVAIVANYLVLRISGDDEKEHSAWLSKKKIKLGSRREDQVPVPSGGVFAEAVLGRFNSAEKLDITRFWNWQDSPIPIQAPDIAAIQAGSRRDPDNTVPGQLSSPVLNIVNPPALPDPQGMGAILAAIQNGNMFRDMSGLAATIGLAQAGLAGAQQGASDAAEQAGKNVEVAAQFGAKLAETAAKLVAAYFTGGAGLAAGAAGGGQAGLLGSAQGMSKAGSILNYARGMDDRGVPSPDSAGGGSTGGETAPASDSGGELGTSSSGATGVPASGNESTAFGTTLGGGVMSAGSALSKFIGDTATGQLGAVVKAGAKKAGIQLAGKVVDQVVGNSSVFGNASFEGVQKAHVLLPGYINAADYHDVGPEQTLIVGFDDLGGGSLSDGLSGGCEVTWTPVTINPAKLRSGMIGQVRTQMEKTVCMRDIEVTCKAGVTVGLSLTKAKVSARIRESHLDPGVLVIGNEQLPFLRATLILKIELDPASIGGVPTGKSTSAEVEVTMRPGSVKIVENKDKAVLNRRYLVE